MRDKSMLVSLFKELNLTSFSKVLFQKILCILLLVCTSTAQALTVGEFVVDSFLDKQLQAEIIVNGNSGDNLDTLEVAIASEQDFKQAGIIRSPLLDEFNFDFIKQSGNVVKIEVTTDGRITEPYIHMLLKIQWNGGQILREFTALIDPPLFSSKPAGPIAAAKTESTVSSKKEELRKELKDAEITDSTTQPSKAKETANPVTVTDENVGVPNSTPNLIAIQQGDTLSEIARKIQQDNPDLSIYQIMFVLFENNQSSFIDNNINNLAKGTSLKINSVDEFSKVNRREGVNFFFNQLAEWSARQDGAQTDQIDPTAEDAATSDTSTTSSDETNASSADATVPESESASSDSENVSVTQDVDASGSSESSVESPEFQVASTDVQANSQEQTSDNANSQEVSKLKSRLAELQASVESTKLENTELKETISILEKQLADSNRLIELNNQELASLAAANKQLSEPGSKVSSVVNSGSGEISGSEAVAVTPPEEPVVTPEEEQPAPTEQENLEVKSDEAVKAQAADADTSVKPAEPEPSAEEVVPSVKPDPAVVKPPVSVEPPVSAPSFLDSIIDKVKEFWRFIVIGLLGVLALILWKVRSSSRGDDPDEAFESTFTVFPEDTADIVNDTKTSDVKAEEIVNAINSEETSIPDQIKTDPNANINSSNDTSVVSSIDMDALREATQSVSDFDVDSSETEITKESSFLTVYNDGDVVVNADEIDPIAEADVYIAYGREDQGEEVLLDGVKNFPDRNDIKIALLGLYAKSSKKDKFNELYDSLVDAGLEDSPQELAEVEELKKKLLGDNSPADNSGPQSIQASTLQLGDEVSNTDFIVNSEVNELSEIDIKSESFDVSEMDFSTNIEDVPSLDPDLVTVDENTVGNDTDKSSLNDEVSINLEESSSEIDSVTLEIDSIKTGLDSSNEIDSLLDDLDEIDLTTDIDSPTINIEISETQDEVSQIDFSSENIINEDNIQIELTETPSSATDTIDIGAEISEISFQDEESIPEGEISLSDIVELTGDIDISSIPTDQNLKPIKEDITTSLVENFDYVDEEISIDNEVTIDLTETIEFSDEEISLSNIDLELGNEGSEGDLLPDGNNDPETQLDLAKVFLELDDVPGAVKILKDLTDNVKVGEEAKELLAKHS